MAGFFGRGGFPFFGGGGSDEDFGGFPGGFQQKPSKNVDTQKLYDILGVDKNAGSGEIKKAYFKLHSTSIPQETSA